MIKSQDEGWAPPSDCDQMGKNALNFLGFLDNGDDFHFGCAFGAAKRIDFVA